MATLNSLSLQQFETLYRNQKPHYEYWFGEAIQKPMPTTLHGILQWVLASLLARCGWMPAVEVRLMLSTLAQPVPDVVADRDPIQNPYPKDPFELCVEILSPSDDLKRAFEKCGHYLGWGIRNVWIIDPERQKAYVMSIPHPEPVEVSPTESFILGIGAEPLFSLQELFAEVARYQPK